MKGRTIKTSLSHTYSAAVQGTWNSIKASIPKLVVTPLSGKPTNQPILDLNAATSQGATQIPDAVSSRHRYSERRSRLLASQTEVSILSCKTSRILGCGWHFGNLSILEGHDLPLRLFLYDDQGRASLYFARFIVFLKLYVRSGEDDRDVGAYKANAP